MTQIIEHWPSQDSLRHTETARGRMETVSRARELAHFVHMTQIDSSAEPTTDAISYTRIIDGCIANDQATLADIWKAGLPLEALPSLAMQGSIGFSKCRRNVGRNRLLILERLTVRMS
jgi:hypothetical protein